MPSSCSALRFREDALEENKMAGANPAQVQSQPKGRCTHTTPLQAEGLKEVVFYRRFRRM